MEKRYWLRGGIWGGALTPFIIDLFAFFSCRGACGVKILFEFFDPRKWASPIIFQTLFLLGYIGIGFLIGSFLGWLYGKIKNRRKLEVGS